MVARLRHAELSRPDAGFAYYINELVDLDAVRKAVKIAVADHVPFLARRARSIEFGTASRRWARPAQTVGVRVS